METQTNKKKTQMNTQNTNLD